MGHNYAKSPLDVACWDLLGQASGQSVCTLLGGRYGESVTLYRAISRDTPTAMADRVSAYRDEGYTRFQLKVGDDPDVDIERRLRGRGNGFERQVDATPLRDLRRDDRGAPRRRVAPRHGRR